jgi:hypothetical protein
MHGRFIQRFSYGNVMSTVALFVALGGVSYAGTSLPANSVGKSASGVGKSASHFSAAQPGPRGPRGPRGFRGPKGPAGLQGQQGPKGDPGTNGTNGTNGATKVVVRSLYLANGLGQVNCNAGERATGGGITGDSTLTVASKSEPTPNAGTPTGWSGTLRNLVSATPSGTVYVVCASP